MTVLDADEDALETILRTGDIRSVLQPIVDLRSGDVVAYEALARGPHGSVLERPDMLVAEARARDLIVELDALCRRRAVEAGARAGLSASHSLFVNVEPDALHDFATSVDDSHPPAVLELTERALTLSPATLVRSLTALRNRGWAVAIDDLGVNPHSLALLPLLAPDIIKLDMSLVQHRPNQHAAMIMSAVTAHAEATGATVLAEGIETEEHLVTARALGADLGQGWLFGHPAEAGDVDADVEGISIRGAVPRWRAQTTPFDVASENRVTKTADKDLLLEVSHFLEARALREGASAVILSTFQFAENFTTATQARYRRLAESGAIVAALARGIDVMVGVPNVHLVDLGTDDPLTKEWDIAVISPDFAALLTARELAPSRERQFEFVLTHDRRLVLDAARMLLGRLVD